MEPNLASTRHGPAAPSRAELGHTAAAADRETTAEPALLSVSGLKVSFRHRRGASRVVNGLDFSLREGGTLAIIGESGSGKSVCCRALMGLLPPSALVEGSIEFDGTDLLGLTEPELVPRRGRDLAMMFQEADRALNPTMSIGAQISEAVRIHGRLGRQAARDRAVDLLHLLRVPSPRRRYSAYPHQLSGGMRQRVMLAIALAAKPRLLIADEPTSSIDVVTQAHLMTLLTRVQRELGMAMILISHDIRLAAHFADSILVIRSGSAVEFGPAAAVINRAAEPYTQALIQAAADTAANGNAFPSRDTASDRGDDQLATEWRELRDGPVLLRARQLTQQYRLHGETVHALTDVSFDVRRGETLAIVGETGSGKSTLANALLQRPKPKSGVVEFRGDEIASLRRRDLRTIQRHIQMVFQSPFGSLDPKWRVREIVEEPLRGYACGEPTQRRQRVSELLDLVGLPPAEFSNRYPRQLSGGQCQRVAIARALALDPEVIICDEAVSSLDVVIQAQILRLFRLLQADRNLAYVFITHDLGVVGTIAHRVAVMFQGRLCEIGPTAEVFRNPGHPYTRELVASASAFDLHRKPPPSPGASTVPVRETPGAGTGGCHFRGQCPRARTECASEAPALTAHGDDHLVACHAPYAREGEST